jgi:predicted Zn-dependent peptidase
MKKTLLLMLTVFLSTGLLAQDKYQWKTETSNGYTYKYVTNDPMKTRFYTLKNGLTVLLTQNQKEPRIAYRMVVRAGSNSDPKEHTGLAHYLEHLLFKGTDKFGSLDWEKEQVLLKQITELYEQYNSTTDAAKRTEIYKEIDKTSGEAAKYSIAGEYPKLMATIGSQGTNAHTFVEETVYDEDIPSNALDLLLTIQSERFRNPILRIFHTELEAVYEEKNRWIDNDGAKMQEEMFSSLFPTHNYGLQTTIGTVEHLKNPSIKAIEKFYQDYYVPNNMAVVLSGDFNPDEVISKVGKAFAYMQPKPVKEYIGTKELPIESPIVKEVYGPTAEQIRILYRSAPAYTRDAFLANIVSSILSNGEAGLFDLNLNKQQKVQNADVSLWQFKDYGIFFSIGVPKEGQSLDELKQLMLDQIEILKTGNFDESLLKGIVANSKLQKVQGLKNNGSRAKMLTDAFIQDLGMKWNEDVAQLEEMNKVTKSDIVAFANKFFTNKNFVLLYKRKGEDKNILKVEKPPITPVETNEGKISPYVENIINTQLPPFKPVWIDYNKDIQKGKVGIADFLYVQNTEDDLFVQTYNFKMGKWNNKLLAAAATYLNYLGTSLFTSEEISKKFYQLACSFTVNVGNEETTITISGLQENYEKAVGLFESLIRNCIPNEEALNGVKKMILKSRMDNKLDKTSITRAMQSYAFYGERNPFNTVLSNQAVENLKASELIDLLHNLNNYEHKITYYGSKSFSQVSAIAQKIHPLPSQWKKIESKISFPRINQTENKVLFANYDAVQAEIYWARNLRAYDPKLEPAVNALNDYFGFGQTSVVYNEIRESKALAYSTYSYLITPNKKEDRYALISYVGCQADKMEQAITAMNELLNVMPKNEQNFESSKTNLMKVIETERIQKSDIIGNYLSSQLKGLDYDLRKEVYAKYGTMKYSDIADLHDQEYSNKSYTYCVLGSDKKINVEDLKKHGPVTILTLEALFGY